MVRRRAIGWVRKIAEQSERVHVLFAGRGRNYSERATSCGHPICNNSTRSVGRSAGLHFAHEVAATAAILNGSTVTSRGLS
jgi:hypothetical protein